MSSRVLLGDLLEGYRVGITPERMLQKDSDASLIAARLLNVRDLSPDSLELVGDEGEIVELQDRENTWKHSLQPSQVLVATKFVHRVGAVVTPAAITRLPLYAHVNVAVLQPDLHRVDPHYLALWIRNQAAELSIEANNKLYRVKMRSVPLKTLLGFPMQIPSLSRQRELVRFNEETQKLREQYEAAILQRQAELKDQLG